MITLCDTGPLVAYFNRNDPHHEWAVQQMRALRPPLRTCEAVLNETALFLREDRLDPDVLFEMVERGALEVDFDFTAHCGQGCEPSWLATLRWTSPMRVWSR